MTEYEIAALALAEAEGIRSQIEVIHGNLSLILEVNVLYVSILSGYLAIAHFLGAKLSKWQAIGVSFFYALLIFANRSTFYSLYTRFIDADKQLALLKDEEIYTGYSGEVTLFVTVLMVLASLFYMWSVKKSS